MRATSIGMSLDGTEVSFDIIQTSSKTSVEIRTEEKERWVLLITKSLACPRDLVFPTSSF
jgi:hypothetical protein